MKDQSPLATKPSFSSILGFFLPQACRIVSTITKSNTIEDMLLENPKPLLFG